MVNNFESESTEEWGASTTLGVNEWESGVLEQLWEWMNGEMRFMTHGSETWLVFCNVGERESERHKIQGWGSEIQYIRSKSIIQTNEPVIGSKLRPHDWRKAQKIGARERWTAWLAQENAVSSEPVRIWAFSPMNPPEWVKKVVGQKKFRASRVKEIWADS